MPKPHVRAFIVGGIVVGLIAWRLSVPSDYKLTPLGAVISTGIPYSFAEKFVISVSGDIYILDTELANVFVINEKTKIITQLCTPKLPVLASDMSVDVKGDLWILDSSQSKVSHIDKECEIKSTFAARRNPLKLQVNNFNEVVVLTSVGETLFDLYSMDGKRLNSYGRRIKYGDLSAESVLNDGLLISDELGGFYFSFNYPPLIHHYTRDGTLVNGFSPQTDITIDPPIISSRRIGNVLEVSQQYQMLVIGMSVDEHGHIYLLISGKNKTQALTQGSQRLVAVTSTGEILKEFSLDTGFHCLAVWGDTLYLLRNRSPQRLEKYLLV
jgi:sugar lactone lactonase YvrE